MKRTLSNICGKISREQAVDDVRKTLELFADIRSTDPAFTYVVLTDKSIKVKSLMWANGSSRMQYKLFGDVVTFDTTYRINLYDMPFGLLSELTTIFRSLFWQGCLLMRDEQEESFQWVFADDGRPCPKKNTHRSG